MVQGRSGESSSRGVSLNGGRLGGGKARAGRRLRALSLASLGALLAVGVALSPAASAQGQPQEEEIGLLFAQTANRGTMKPIKGTPRFNLRLRGVNSQVVWFSDRPARQSAHIPVPEFTRSWAGFGFVDDPPNAALTLLRAGDRQDTVVVELGRPHFKRKKNTIRYSAQLLDEATGNLSHLESDRDPRVNRRFRAPSLFIDDAAGRVAAGCLLAPYSSCRGANLQGEDLSGLKLRKITLTEADLFAADLNGADLSFADLQLADLTEADLSNSKLLHASFNGANLTNADLRGADLEGADLRDADLTGANLSGARFCQTRMPDGSRNNRDC